MVKKLFLNKSMTMIKKHFPDYNQNELAKIKYGLEGLYLTLTKLIIILLLASLLNIFTQALLLILFYSILRTFSLGLHTKKSYSCLLFSIIVFLVPAFFIKYMNISMELEFVISVTCCFLFVIYSPADSEKKPLINRNKRYTLKLISSTIALVYCIFIFINGNIIISNYLLVALVIQTIMILPLTYKLFNLKYNNYKYYIRNS
jgi:accessory gene regulator B